jgi:hypothetical protein
MVTRRANATKKATKASSSRRARAAKKDATPKRELRALDGELLEGKVLSDKDVLARRRVTTYTRKDGTVIEKVSYAQPGPVPAERDEDYAPWVERMAICGTPRHTIARVLGCSLEALNTNYPDELEHGQNVGNAMVAQTAFEIAVSGAVPAMTMFWLKTRAGWRETERFEVSGPDGKPMQVEDARAVLLAKLHDKRRNLKGGDDDA